MNSALTDIIIVGAGGFGREVLWLLNRINSLKATFNVMGFVDDNESISGTEVGGLPVLGGTDYLKNYPDKMAVTIAIGNSKVRKALSAKFRENKNLSFPNLIAPTALLGNNITLGEGNIVCEGVIMTTDITVKDFCIFNLYSTVGHDAVIGNFVTVFPDVSISGYDIIGEGSYLGVGTKIIQEVNIGENTVLGAGAVVVKNIEGNCTAVGVPAKIIK